MKKIITMFLVVAMMTIGFVFAAANQTDNITKDVKSAVVTSAKVDTMANKTMPDGNLTKVQDKVLEQSQDRVRNNSQNAQEIREQIQKRMQSLEQKADAQNMKNERANERLKNQNQVRVAVHSFLAIKDSLNESMGKKVSEIAKSFNSSFEDAVRNEEKIQNRSGFARFFMGGDREAAKQMESLVEQNQQKIQELKQIKEKANVSEEVKQIMNEQIANMEQEQERMQNLALEEQKKKGLFGWLFK